MSPGEKRVSFLVAGVQKGGTTALFDYLAALPALELPPIKEAHFFDDEERVDWSCADHARYHALFEAPDRLWGEATPIYIYWPNALERIRAYNPAMKLILLFRDPIQRAWSHWKMEYARGKETKPFGWCIRDGRARQIQGTPYPGFHRVYSYVERGFYGQQMERALALFPAEQLLLIASETLKCDPDATLRRICDFLGVPTPAESVRPKISRPAIKAHYPSTLENEDVIYLQRQFTADWEHFRSLTAGPNLWRCEEHQRW